MTLDAPVGPASRTDAPRAELSWIEPYPAVRELTSGLALDDAYAARETIELAYIAALQHLPIRQRAVFILRKVMGLRAAETAEILDMTVAAVNSALQRSRAAIEERLPGVSQQAELERLGPAAVSDLARSCAWAIEHADLDALMALPISPSLAARRRPPSRLTMPLSESKVRRFLPGPCEG